MCGENSRKSKRNRYWKRKQKVEREEEDREINVKIQYKNKTEGGKTKIEMKRICMDGEGWKKFCGDR